MLKTFNSTIMECGDNTTITIKKNPRISITYDNTQDINTVLFDIECIMQFFGLLIGSVSDVEDICLETLMLFVQFISVSRNSLNVRNHLDTLLSVT